MTPNEVDMTASDWARLPTMLSVKEVALLMRVSEPTVRSWIDRWGLPSCRPVRRLRIRKGDLLEWLDRRQAA